MLTIDVKALQPDKPHRRWVLELQRGGNSRAADPPRRSGPARSSASRSRWHAAAARGKTAGRARDASARIREPSGAFTAAHVVVASGGGLVAACDRRIIIDTTVTDAAGVRPGGRCRRPACAGLFDTARPAAPMPASSAAAPGPSVFRCTECGHGGSLRAWTRVNIHGDVGPDGLIERSDYEDDAYWPLIEFSDRPDCPPCRDQVLCVANMCGT
jgi:hypothetical protein